MVVILDVDSTGLDAIEILRARAFFSMYKYT